MGLFTPKWNNANSLTRQNAINNTNDVRKLAEIIRKCKFDDTIILAQDKIVKLMISASNLNIENINSLDANTYMIPALDVITDEQILADIAIKTDDSNIQYAALDRIKNTVLLTEMLAITTVKTEKRLKEADESFRATLNKL